MNANQKFLDEAKALDAKYQRLLNENKDLVNMIVTLK